MKHFPKLIKITKLRLTISQALLSVSICMTELYVHPPTGRKNEQKFWNCMREKQELKTTHKASECKSEWGKLSCLQGSRSHCNSRKQWWEWESRKSSMLLTTACKTSIVIWWDPRWWSILYKNKDSPYFPKVCITVQAAYLAGWWMVLFYSSNLHLQGRCIKSLQTHVFSQAIIVANPAQTTLKVQVKIKDIWPKALLSRKF